MLITRRSKAPLRASTIRSSIGRALRTFAAAEASGVDVRIRGHAVTLEGSVASWSEREVIVKASWAAEGVTAVDDSLLVWRSDRGTRDWVRKP